MRIGVFDSGMGGITVLTALRKKFRGVDFVYLGDTAHVPYGTKSPEQIQRLSIEGAKVLKAKKVDAMIVACNTASSLAIDAIRNVMNPVPVFGMVEPGIEAVFHVIQGRPPSSGIHKTILVLATKATVRSGAYGKGIRSRISENSTHAGTNHFTVIEQACPLLVPMIEEGWIDHPILHKTLEEYLSPHISSLKKSEGIALLGCTHYPWILEAVSKALPGWQVVDSAQAVVQNLERSSFMGQIKLSQNLGQNQIEWIFTDPLAIPAFALEMMDALK
jgi:glutamate racemase